MKTWLEEYTVGQEIRTPYFRLCTEEILNYARNTHDLRPVLFDSPEAAKQPMFVPPLYLLSLGMCLLSQAPERSYLPEKLIAFDRFERVSFSGRATAEDLIYSWAMVDAVEIDGRRGRLCYRHEVRNEKDEALVVNRHAMFVGRRTDAP